MPGLQGASFSHWLKQRRKLLDLTRNDLARCAGCSPKTIEKIESGERRPSRQVAELLLHCLQVPDEERPGYVLWARKELAPGGSGLNVKQNQALAAESDTHSPNTQHTPNNLPVPLTSFIGREDVLGAVRSLLERRDVRLVTLTGPPGIGKTRLSVQAGASLLGSFKDGVFFVPLATVSDTGMVASAVAKELNVRETRGRTLMEALKSHLLEKEALLVLDNFEQIVEAAPLATELLTVAPGVKVLATSREALNVYGEHNYAVPPLRMPDSVGIGVDRQPMTVPARDALQYEAVRLFVERATAAKNGFDFSEENAAGIVAICSGLDGLPLAIELAAARVAHLSIGEMLSRLQSRLDLLATGPRDVTSRQKTLRGAIEWSYDLLEENERKLFSRLSVFVGGCTREALASVCDLGDEDDSSHALVGSLHAKSLVEIGHTTDGQERFRMLQTIREYAWEMLDKSGERDALQARHAACFLSLAETSEPMLAGPEQAAWLDSLSAEHDNLMVALNWLLKHDVEAALRMGAALTIFWYRRGHLSEGRAALSSALSHGEEVAASIRGKALNGAGTLAYAQGDYDEAKLFYTQSLAAQRATGDKKAIARALNNIALIASNQGEYEAALTLYNESMALWEELGDKVGIALSLNNLMVIALAQGDYAGARVTAQRSVELRRETGDKAGLASSLSNLGIVLFALGEDTNAAALQEESLHIRRELGDRHGIANSLLNLGELARYRDDAELAEQLCGQCLQICRELGDKPGICNALVNLGHLAQSRGDLDTAARFFTESMELFREGGDRRGLAQSLVGLAAVAASRGQVESAARLLGAVDATLEGIGSRMYPQERRDYERTLAVVRPQLSDTEWQIAWQHGRELETDDI
jgi:predicted ATPase/transcriptional regulator with XRE-family HTH domain